MTNINSFEDLYAVIQKRIKDSPKGSYVASLVKAGKNKISKKIGEETMELIIEIVKDKQDKKAVVYEATDLFFHIWVLLAFLNITPQEILGELNKRHQIKTGK